jgi:ABC-type glycerol-3-phosphate transport system permease component
VAFLWKASRVWPALVTIITRNTLPLETLTFRASVPSLPKDLIEAAEVEGATAMQLAGLSTFVFLARTSLKTMPLGRYALFGEDTAEWGKIMAASALTTSPAPAPAPPGRRSRARRREAVAGAERAGAGAH